MLRITGLMHMMSKSNCIFMLYPNFGITSTADFVEDISFWELLSLFCNLHCILNAHPMRTSGDSKPNEKERINFSLFLIQKCMCH